MKIAYLGGNCGEGSAPWSTENAYIDAFRKLDHEVTPVKQQDARSAVGTTLVDSDLVIYTRTHNPSALTPEWTDIWRLLEQNGTMTASIHLDVFRGIPEREGWVERGDPLFTTGTVFTADGSMPEWWKDRGVNHVWLPPAFDDRHLDTYHEAFHDSVPRPIDATGKIVFVGSERYHQCYPFRETLIRHLRQTYGERFLFIGDGGQWGKVRMGPLASLYAQDAIFVGDHCFATERRPRYWSDRLPETLGRGGFLVYPETPGMDEQGFHDDEDIGGVTNVMTYEPGDLDALDTSISYAIGVVGRAGRAEIAEAGRAEVLRAHTYNHRAAQVLDHLGLA